MIRLYSFLILLVSSSSFCQDFEESDFFLKNEQGVILSYDIFKDFIDSENSLSKSLLRSIEKAVVSNKKFLETYDKLDPILFTSYREFVFLSKILKRDTFDISKKIYDRMHSNQMYYGAFFEVLCEVIDGYNKNNRSHMASNLLENHSNEIKSHKKFTCGNGASYYYTSLGRLYFDTYSRLNQKNIALTHGFKYLLNDKQYASKIANLILSFYEKEKVIYSFINLENHYMKSENKFDSYYSFLDFEIYDKHISGMYIFNNRAKPFEELQKSEFYKAMELALN